MKDLLLYWIFLLNYLYLSFNDRRFLLVYCGKKVWLIGIKWKLKWKQAFDFEEKSLCIFAILQLFCMYYSSIRILNNRLKYFEWNWNINEKRKELGEFWFDSSVYANLNLWQDSYLILICIRKRRVFPIRFGTLGSRKLLLYPYSIFSIFVKKKKAVWKMPRREDKRDLWKIFGALCSNVFLWFGQIWPDS